MRILQHTVFTCIHSIYMAAFGKTYKMDLFPRPYFKLKSAGVLWGHYPTMPFLLTCAQIQLLVFSINSSLLCIILFRLPHNLFILPTLQLQTVHTPLFFTQHPIILQYTYLPTCLPILHFTPPPSVLLSPCQLLPLTPRWHNPCHIVTLQEFRC